MTGSFERIEVITVSRGAAGAEQKNSRQQEDKIPSLQIP
jgi:hypothetical protein